MTSVLIHISRKNTTIHGYYKLFKVLYFNSTLWLFPDFDIKFVKKTSTYCKLRFNVFGWLNFG